MAESAGRSPDHIPVRPPGRLHARRARWHRLGPAPQPSRRGPPARPGAAPARAELRHRPGAAADLEGGHCAGAGRHPRAGRLRRRIPVRPAQSLALGREEAAPLHRQERRAGPARRRAPAPGMAGAAIAGAGRRDRPLAAGQWAERRGRRGARARLGRGVKALDLLSGGRPPAGRARARGLGGRRPRAKRASPRRSSRPGGAAGCGTSPATICATASSPWPRPASRSRTIRA